ncbi:MAG: N-acetyl sugar amidotransferase [Mogibacterium sp.]|nr:N-acetyl sugar amidotransferase [Mogibacterium sp.]
MKEYSINEPIIKREIERPYQICTCCVMDTSDDDISFDEKGVCMRCNEYKERIEPEWKHGRGHEKELGKLISDIKRKGEGKDYDCILGLSGGLDSSYMLHLAVREWGLRPFVFHIDAGWNLPVAEENIRKITDKLGVELHIEKMDWQEMKEMQLAWFRTGLESLDAPQDHAFIALIDRFSRELGVKYILNGYNISTEIIADPASWGKGAGPTGDGTYMRDVIKKHCSVPIKNYTFTNGFKHKFWIPYVLGVKTVKPLNYVPFTREEMIKTLVDEYGYIPYGQKHFEDLLTKFLEAWWMPTRFGHDIRRAQLSSLVVTGQMTREEALAILENPPASEEECAEMFREIAKRLEISEEELREYHEMGECTEKFRSQEKLYNFGIRLYEKLGIEKRIRK